MSVTSFQKGRIFQVVIVDSSNYCWAFFGWSAKNWYQRSSLDSVKSAFASGFPQNEISNLPFWYTKGGSSDTLSMYYLPPKRDYLDVGQVLTVSAWDSVPEVVSKGYYPIRNVTSGTYLLYFSIDGGSSFNVSLTSVIANGEGNLIDIVRALNADLTFNAAAEAYVTGLNGAAQLGIRSKTDGTASSVEILTGGASDCSELLGFSLEKENLYDEGEAAELLGTFTQSVDYKAS